MVELGEHCHTHIIPRLKKVIDGEDKVGLLRPWIERWCGFRYYHLAPSLLEKDKWGNWVVNKTYNPAMLVAAGKLEGFIRTSDTVYWQQGHWLSETLLTSRPRTSTNQLQALSDEVGQGRSLLVLCSAFREKADRYSNLTIKKIPKTVLTCREWAKMITVLR